jgi:putative flippase GtrA
VDIGQFLLFCFVGVLNTLVDYSAYNALTGGPFKWKRIPANIGSTTAAMIFSFLANRNFVFQSEAPDLVFPDIKFLWVTVVSAYLIQNIIIYLTSTVITGPGRLLQQLLSNLPFLKKQSSEFLEKNIVKTFAVSGGMFWNYFWYKFHVFPA